MASRLSLVDHNDLLMLLDYAQPDEERDIERDPENDNPGHVVYVIRRLRRQANIPLWDVDSIQFARLLAEIMANVEELDDSMLRPVAESMDLELDQVLELFDRAQHVWDTHVAAIP